MLSNVCTVHLFMEYVKGLNAKFLQVEMKVENTCTKLLNLFFFREKFGTISFEKSYFLFIFRMIPYFFFNANHIIIKMIITNEKSFSKL